MSTRKQSLLDYLFRNHRQELLAFTERPGSAVLAEDVVQEAYLRLLQHPDLESIANPRAYLYKIAANLRVDYFKQQNTRAKYVEETELDFDALASLAPGPESVADSEHRLALCLAALDSLPEIYRHVFLLHRLDGLTHAEIAQALGMPRRTVERYCAKALAHCFAQAAQDQA